MEQHYAKINLYRALTSPFDSIDSKQRIEKFDK